jgi:FAD/FMN-containing dehydrogenase
MSDQAAPRLAAALDALTRELTDPPVRPGAAEYERLRAVWNAAIDRRPGAIVRCGDLEDVVRTVRIAAAHDVPVTVRGGGHNVAGRSIADGALLLDLSRLRGVDVHAATRRATVQGGAHWADLDAATARHGLATTGGLVSTTGVAGLTLGGGVGWLMRRHGLACDNLRRASVVLGDGRLVRASAEEHPDLYWALCGGGGGFGVVTELEFDLHPVQDVVAGLTVFAAADAVAVLERFRDVVPDAPDEFCALAVLTHAPPLPFLAPDWHGRPVVIVATCWCGAPGQGDAVQAALVGSRPPLAAHVGPMPYVTWQRMQDPGAPAGRYQYWKTANLATLSDATIARLATAAGELPTPTFEIHVQHLGGAVARRSAGATAFASRDVPFFVNLIGCAAEAGAFGAVREFARRVHGELAAEALGSRQPNFTGQDDPGEPGAAVAGRLAEVRARYAGRVFAG